MLDIAQTTGSIRVRAMRFSTSRESFAEDAPPALDVMLDFLDSVFYPEGE